MVLKIAKPPRDKDSIAGLAWQCCTWMVSSPVVGLSGGQHVLEAEHLASRSYLPSAAGQAAYYQVLSSLEHLLDQLFHLNFHQAETCGGLAVCQPLTRISNHHHFQGENPAEEVSSCHQTTSKPTPNHIIHINTPCHTPHRPIYTTLSHCEGSNRCDITCEMLTR